MSWIKKFWVSDGDKIYPRPKFYIYKGGYPKEFKTKKGRDEEWYDSRYDRKYIRGSSSDRGRENYKMHTWRIDIDRTGKIKHYDR